MYPGPVGVAISKGKVKEICHMTTHGGRPRSMIEGEVVIDVAFIAAPAVDANGSLTGSEGPASCGVLGYAHAGCRNGEAGGSHHGLHGRDRQPA